MSEYVHAETIEIEWLNISYKATYYHGSNVVCIKKWVTPRFKKPHYKTIYFGHIEPLKEMLGFFERRAAKPY